MSLRYSVHRASFKTQLRVNGEAGEYVTTSGERHSLRAVRGQTPFRLDSDGNRGGTIQRSTDWLFDAADFRAAVGRWPKDGDRFQVVGPVGVKTEFRVSPFNGEPVYRLEPTGVHVRVHTLEYGTL